MSREDVERQISEHEASLAILRRRLRLIKSDDIWMSRDTATNKVMRYLKSAGAPRKVSDIIGGTGIDREAAHNAMAALLKRGFARRTLGVGMYEYKDRTYE